ncbi:hypothetical protein PanWU01x14_117140, partial [Parasponia andersonii]
DSSSVSITYAATLSLQPSHSLCLCHKTPFSSFTTAQPPASRHQSHSLSSNAAPSAQQLCLVRVATSPPHLRSNSPHPRSNAAPSELVVFLAHCLAKSHSSGSSATPLFLSLSSSRPSVILSLSLSLSLSVARGPQK